MQEIAEILRTDYVRATNAIYLLEVTSRTRSKRAVYELRDTLDHMAIALQSGTSPDAAKGHLVQIRSHLRRASVEPMEWLAERSLLRIAKIQQWGLWWWRFLFLNAPMNPEELFRRIVEIGNRIAEGRRKKASNEAFDDMVQAYTDSVALLEKLQPAELRSRLFAVCLTLLSLGVGVLIGKLI